MGIEGPLIPKTLMSCGVLINCFRLCLKLIFLRSVNDPRCTQAACIFYWIRIIMKSLDSSLHWSQYASVISCRRKLSQPNYRPCNEPPALRLCRRLFIKQARNAVHSYSAYTHKKMQSLWHIKVHTPTLGKKKVTLVLNENFKPTTLQKKQVCICKYTCKQIWLKANP